jgi:hypothetical protein
VDDGEFVSAEPRHGVAVMSTAAQPFGQDPQHGVAGRMAECVIEALEAVEIDEEQHHTAVGAAVLGHRRVEALAKQCAIGEIGQPIMMGHVPDALGFKFLVGDVFGDAEQILRLLPVVADHDHPGAKKAEAIMRRVDRLLLDDLNLPRLKHFAVARDEAVGLVLGKHIMVGSTDDGFALDAEKFLAGAVQQDETEIARVLDEHYGGNVLDDGFEELPGAEQRAQPVGGLGSDMRRRRGLRRAGGLSGWLHRLPLRPRITMTGLD